ncbi:hypothetical protein BOSP111201_01285 [Bordetella sputigena]|uniref:hypothetical protein n=1 Tax=Bordetella sputigena TaxID=1416810 RepID=UPI0039EE4057
MPPSSYTARPSRWIQAVDPAVWAFLSFACILVAAKWMLIHAYGNVTPYWDQWDAEADRLYAPYVAGTLHWMSLLAPHNEHHILTTRLFALGLFIVNGQWNPLLQMAVNAILHAVTLVYLLSLLRRAVPHIAGIPALAVVLAVFCIPYAWENTLAGFQAQFYFNLLFSFAGMWFLVTETAFSRRWWLGIAMAVLAYLSLASGIFTVLAAAAVLLLRELRHGALRGKTGLAVTVLLLLFVVGYVLTPVIPNHAFMKATSFGQFLEALLQSLSWPYKARVIWPLLLNLPGLLFAFLILRTPRDRVLAVEWFILALLAWSVGQAAVTAYGRAIAVLAPRYFDLLAIGILANFACLLWLCDRALMSRQRLMKIAALGAWLCIVTIGFVKAWPLLVSELDYKRQIGVAEETNVRNFLRTGDRTAIEGKPFLETPYPNADRLMHLLSDPGIRRILPAVILPAGDPDRIEGRFDHAVDELLAHAYILLIVGAACAVISVMGSRADAGIERRGKYKQEMHE